MIRKSLSALAVAGLVAALAACGTNGGSDSTSSGGIKTGPGVTDKTISVGLLSDFSGPIAEAATAGTLGSEVKFDAVNAAGGVCGRKIVGIRGDTKYDPQQTVQAYRTTAPKIAMITQLLGTTSVQAIKDSIGRDDMPTLAISLNTQTLSIKDIYVPVPTFEVELMNALTWAAEKAGATADKPVKIALATSTDENGDIYLDALKSVAAATPGVEIVGEVGFSSSDKDFTAPASKLKKTGADYVILGSGPTEAAGMIGTSAQLGFMPTWVSNSGAWYTGLAKPLAALLPKWFVSAGYASLGGTTPGNEELNAALAKYAPGETTNDFTVAGWLFGQATVDALTKACENKDLTRAGINKAMVDLKVDYNGITPAVDFGNGDQIVSYSSRINSIASDGSLNPVTDFITSDAAKAWGEKAGY